MLCGAKCLVPDLNRLSQHGYCDALCWHRGAVPCREGTWQSQLKILQCAPITVLGTAQIRYPAFKQLLLPVQNLIVCITSVVNAEAGFSRRPARPCVVRTAQADSSDQELWELHEELVQQVDIRSSLAKANAADSR